MKKEEGRNIERKREEEGDRERYKKRRGKRHRERHRDREREREGERDATEIENFTMLEKQTKSDLDDVGVSLSHVVILPSCSKRKYNHGCKPTLSFTTSDTSSLSLGAIWMTV